MLSNDASYEYAWESAPLTGMAIAPLYQNPSKMIVILHGYQGDARSNMNFARVIARAFPEAIVFIPNGISEVPGAGNPHIRQWWNLPPFEGKYYSSMPYYAPGNIRAGLDQIVKEAHVCAGILNKFIKKQLQHYKLALQDCFIAGISQGGITAFEMVLFRKELHQDKSGTHLGGLAVIGAGIPGADRLRFHESGRLPAIPVLLARGTHDEIFPSSVNSFSDSLLRENRIPVFKTEADSGHFGLEHAVTDDVCRFFKKWENT